MIPLRIARFLIPAQNPLGFGAVDFLALALALVLVVVIPGRERIVSAARALAARPTWSMAALALLPIGLRLAQLPWHPVPTPRVADDFSYLLLGDTLAHFRLANPMHPMHRFFEGVFILQTPKYASLYPVGQGLALAFGQLVFHQPWAGVVLTVGLLCGLCYWMLRAWVAAEWALLGGVLAAFTFGVMSPWMNTYWGGAVSGIAGCLIFGSLPRRKAMLLGLGLALELLTRPFEFTIVAATVMLYSVAMRLPARIPAIAGLVVLPAFGVVALQNKQITGSWTMLPYQLSRYEHGVPATFTFQKNPVPHEALTVEQQVDYNAQLAVHGNDPEALGTYLERLAFRARFYRFFFPAPMYLVLPAFLFVLRERRYVWVIAALVLLSTGTNFYPYFYPHYIAAAACLFGLIGVKSLETVSRLRFGKEAVTLVLVLCLADFIYQYAADPGDPEPTRTAIDAQLAHAPGKQLVFVRYWPQHSSREWIRNAADIDGSQVVRALDLGPDEDLKLRQYYPDRHVWLLEPDARPPKLTPGAP